VRKILNITWLLLLLTTAARAAHTEAQLLLGAEMARPGDTVLAGVKLTMQPGWHTYWKNPGSAGKATSIKWTLPPGVTAGEIQWPLPKKITGSEITSYIYAEEVVLLVPLKLDQTVAAGPVNIGASIAWLECNESCLPADTDVEAGLEIGAEAKNSSEAPLLAQWQAKVPSTEKKFSTQALWQKAATNDARPLLFEVDWASKAEALHRTVDFFPAASDDYEFEAETKKILDSTGELEFTKVMKKFSGGWPQKVSGVLVVDDAAYEAEFPVTDTAITAAAPGAASVAAAGPPPSLLKMLLLAFVGGLILNVMPCVLPVIALKILGFVSEAKSDKAHIRKLGFIYTLGVLASFLTLAALVIGVKAAGHKAAWGMQFDSPVFIVCLTTLVTLIAMNLFGVFEVTLNGGTMDAANKLASQSGASGAFFNGVLATALATPCTAPVLGTALGFAFAQPSSILVLIFLAVGAGLAAPYLILSWNPAWLIFLPKPGAWMEKFKMAMGFPMLATVMWLLSVAASTYDKKVVWLGVFLVFAATAAWIFGEFAQRGRRNKFIAGVVALGVLISGYAFALEKQLDWRHPQKPTAAVSAGAEANGTWRVWSPEAVIVERTSGHPVLVDFTADWCLTCQLNARTSLDIDSVRKKLKDIGAVAFKADYTHFPDNITEELNRYNRAGVPLVLVYPKDSNAPPFVLPELLTEGIVLEKLDAAVK
jgi:thiol:disulfide interchange protein DsbD